MIIRNTKNFFNWQGNHLHWHNYYSYIFLAILLILTITIFVTKNKIYYYFHYKAASKQKIWKIFNNEKWFWQTIGILGLFFSIIRIILLVIFGYPLSWENLGLHLCRLHINICFLLLAINKKQYIKHLTYMGFIGIVFGLLFAHLNSHFINFVNEKNGFDQDIHQNIKDFQNYSHNSDFQPSILEKIMHKNKMSFYNVGPDNWWFYDVLLAHVFLGVLPFVIRSAYKQKFTNKELHWNQIIYLLVAIFIWVLNIIMTKSPSENWRSNYWYLGLDAYNDQKNALGWISAWPQNLIFYSLVGTSVTFIFHYLWMFLNKFQFLSQDADGKFKFLNIQKSQHFLNSKQEYSVGFKKFCKNFIRKN